MKKYLIIFCAMLMLVPANVVKSEVNPEESIDKIEIEDDNNVESNELYPYPKLEDLMKELKEKRKVIEQQRLEEIKAKKLEQEQKKEVEGEKGIEVEDAKEPVESKKEPVDDNKIPKLIVRLRGKHSSKYLCAYDFKFTDDNKENEFSKELISDYNVLLKKPSLKVRALENINFEFSEEPKSIEIYGWDEGKVFPLKNVRGTIKVPDLEKKIVVVAEGRYKEGFVRYAIVLDIRK